MADRRAFLRTVGAALVAGPAAWGALPAEAQAVVSIHQFSFDHRKGWRNYTFRYAPISKVELIRRIKEAMAKTKFIAPLVVPKEDGDA